MAFFGRLLLIDALPGPRKDSSWPYMTRVRHHSIMLVPRGAPNGWTRTSTRASDHAAEAPAPAWTSHRVGYCAQNLGEGGALLRLAYRHANAAIQRRSA